MRKLVIDDSPSTQVIFEKSNELKFLLNNCTDI
jgi:hypothetical protein